MTENQKYNKDRSQNDLHPDVDNSVNISPHFVNSDFDLVRHRFFFKNSEVELFGSQRIIFSEFNLRRVNLIYILFQRFKAFEFSGHYRRLVKFVQRSHIPKKCIWGNDFGKIFWIVFSNAQLKRGIFCTKTAIRNVSVT